MAFPYGQTVTLIRRTVSGQDEYGNDTYVETLQTIAGCVVQPSGSSEALQFTDQVSTGIVVYVPAGTVVSPVDAIEIDGIWYEVDGEPRSWVSPFSGHTSPTEVQASRVTGASV